MTFRGVLYRLYLLKQVLVGKHLPVPRDEPGIKNGVFNTTPGWLKFYANANIFKLLDHLGILKDYSGEMKELNELCRHYQTQDRNISEYDVNHFLYNLVCYSQPQKIIEVGTYIGTASCFLSAAQHRYLKKADMYLVDIRKENLEKTERNLAKFGLEDDVKSYIGDSVKVAESGNLEISDLVFLDADHKLEGVRRDINAYWHLLRDEGIMVLHDSVSWNGVRTVTNEVAKSGNEVVTLASSLGSGISIIIKKSNTAF